MIVDPAVPHDVAALLRDNAELLRRVRSGWTPRRRRRLPLHGAAITAAGSAVLGFALFVAGEYIHFVLIMICAALLTVAVLLRPRPGADVKRRHAAEREVYDQARAHDGRYVLHDDLDEAARALMTRAQTAVEQVMSSRVNAEGLLDALRNAVTLPAREWEIARLLAKLSALRAEHGEVVAEGVTPEVAAVAEPLAQVLDSSLRAVLDRVVALERYAGHVAGAERAYRARNQIERLSARLPRYEELLAESGADGVAVPELSGLSDDADRLEQALRDSVSSAHEAFRHLRR
ncbi:MAG: hypothetical protein HOV96_25580 [Nonomuraea sp.]|nr:hypothetical protein [Nonomuraea sp.]NUP65787.1 hypothetical protein [Nonomuraea sp.]NUP80921.1 hypothetical protein [Nonomuraea sp.]NUS01629.1 hypothetical protein [Nonomuraea sp.]NUT42066.1 hypothetical protein [Thermoactinospora sp.]